jgi:restriction system protein
MLRRRISDATDDDLLAAYLHWIEGQIALDFSGVAADLAASIKGEHEHLETLAPPLGTPFTTRHYRAHGELRAILKEGNLTAAKAVKEAQRVWRELCAQTGSELSSRFMDAADPVSLDVEIIGTLREQVDRAERNVRTAMARHRDEMHSLALLEQAMDLFLASEDSIALEDIHSMTSTAFEQTVAALTRRDGHEVIREAGGARDLGADVIAVTTDRLRVVFQCKHRQAGRGKVGSPDMQTLNGTARPEHKADIVIAVTNGWFTKPAIDFARTHDIHLLDQVQLKRWATWGEPLLSVLNQDKPQSAAAG